MPANKSEGIKSIKKKKVVAGRRWTYREIIKILRYAVNTVHTGTFEKPTARQYYINLTKDLRIDASWHLMYYKICNLRRTYDKAEEWLKTVSGLTEEGAPLPENIRDQLLRICPHYDMLKIIFLQKKKRKANKEVETNNVEPDDSATACDNEASIHEIKTESMHTLEPLDIRTSPTDSLEPSSGSAREPQNLTNNLNNFNIDTNTEENLVHNCCNCITNKNTNQIRTTNLNSNYNPNMVITQLLQLEESRERNRIEKTNVDLELQEKKFLLEERRLVLEERKFSLEERKADRDYELKKMELEMKERLMRYEYELKYTQHNI